MIRFDTGHRTGHEPHINFDPRGYPSRKNLHLYVPQSMVSAAYYLQKTAEVADCFATVATYATDMYRLGAAAQLDYRSYYTAKTEVHRLEGYYRQAQDAPPEVTGLDDPDLDGHLCFSYQRNLRAQAILLEQVQASLGGMAVPRNALQEAASIAGGYAGGLLGATSGALVGTTAVTAAGTVFLGPAGTLIGLVAGAVIGSAYGGVKGAQAGSRAAEAAVRKVFTDGLQQAYDDLASGAGKTADQVVGAASEYSSSAYGWLWRRWSGSQPAASSARELAGTAVSSASKCASTALEASTDTAVSLWGGWSTSAAASSVSGLASSALKFSTDAASTAWSWSSSAPSSASGWLPSSTANSSSWWTSSSSSSWWTSPSSSSSAAKWSKFSKDAASTAWGWSSSAASSASAWTSSKAAATASGNAWRGWSSSAASSASSWMTSSSASDYFWKK